MKWWRESFEKRFGFFYDTYLLIDEEAVTFKGGDVSQVGGSTNAMSVFQRFLKFLALFVGFCCDFLFLVIFYLFISFIESYIQGVTNVFLKL